MFMHSSLTAPFCLRLNLGFARCKNAYKSYLFLALYALLSFSISGCTWLHPNSRYETPKSMSELQQGRRYFEGGYYKHAMRMLLPLACDGNAEAEYAVGYMYYYGYGVAQDTDVGAIWIKRSADQGYQPAVHALHIIERGQAIPPKYEDAIEQKAHAH